MKVLEAVHHDWPIATEVRKLQSRLWRLARREDLKVIMITSALGGEGKTTTAAYLAATLALHPGRRILVVDLDLRRPNLRAHFETDQQYGLIDHLQGGCELESVITRTDLEGLDIVLAGEPADNPGMLLDSPALGQALDVFRERYDLVLLDTPPLVPVADATGLIPLADGILLVVMAGKTPRPLLTRARELCLGMGGRIVGLVVGNAEEASPETYSKGYYRAYARQARGGE